MTKKRFNVKVVTFEAKKPQGEAPYRDGYQHPKNLGKSEVKSAHKQRRM